MAGGGKSFRGDRAARLREFRRKFHQGISRGILADAPSRCGDVRKSTRRVGERTGLAGRQLASGARLGRCVCNRAIRTCRAGERREFVICFRSCAVRLSALYRGMGVLFQIKIFCATKLQTDPHIRTDRTRGVGLLGVRHGGADGVFLVRHGGGRSFLACRPKKSPLFSARKKPKKSPRESLKSSA